MTSPFHPGELEVQRRAGVSATALRVGGSIRSDFPPVAAEFLAARTLVVVAAADAAGRPWASPLSGEPGFARVLDPRAVRFETSPLEGDVLNRILHQGALAGVIAVDFATRRRLRFNGKVERVQDGVIDIRTDQVYSNCPKYIQARTPEPGSTAGHGGLLRRGQGLTPVERAWIRGADTFFVATLNPGEGADASHRGGQPGFVEVDGNRITWPDYAGNTMFNTLGNIAAWPRAGLLFPDFTTGAALQVTGKAGIEWGPDRQVYLEVEEVAELASALPERLRLREYSPFNPPLTTA